MRERGIKKGLIRRVEDVLRETRSKVRRKGRDVGKSFWTARKVRHGYPLSPLLFNIMLVDIKKKMEKVK